MQVVQPTPAYQPVIVGPPPVTLVLPTPVAPGATPAIQPAIQPVPAPGTPPQTVAPVAMPGSSTTAPSFATPFPGYPGGGAVLPGAGSTPGSMSGSTGGAASSGQAGGGSSVWSPDAAQGPPALASNSSDGGSSASTPVPAKYVPPVVPTAAPQPLLVSIDSVGGYQVGACVVGVGGLTECGT